MPNVALGRALCRTVLPVLFFGTLSPALAQQTFQRKYTASACITLFGVPVLSRSQVGYGWAVERTREDRGIQTVDLEFLAGSIPEHAHGLHRFGYIRESVREKNRAPVRSEYFGLITANREQSLNDASAALHAAPSESVSYVAASGQMENRRARCAVRHLVLPQPRLSAAMALTRLGRDSFASPPSQPLDVDKTFSTAATGTFLYCLRQAMLSPDTVSRAEFIYNAKLHVLHTEKHPDDSVDSEFRRQGSLLGAGRVLRLVGSIKNEDLRQRTAFTVWYQEGTGTMLPLRFEFKPAAYLKLVFDLQPAPGLPSEPGIAPADPLPPVPAPVASFR